MQLITQPNITDPDDFYERLIRLHEGMDETRSNVINARLILLLANHVGDRAALYQALEIAAAERG